MVKKVLVTGADGFIGSHLTEQLVSEGYETRAFVYYNSFNSWGWLDSLSKDVLDHIEVVAGDIRDPIGVDSAVEGCSHVLHLAALIAIPFSYSSPDAYVQTNVTGTLNILQSARRHSVEHLVCTSTSETYGTAKFVPISESHPLNAQSPYAATKVASDQMALAFHRSFNMPVSILRPFNTFGPQAICSGCYTDSHRANRVRAKRNKAWFVTPYSRLYFCCGYCPRLHSNNEYRSLLRRGGQYRHWS